MGTSRIWTGLSLHNLFVEVIALQIIASCSEDSNVIIWEEQESVTGSDGAERGRWQKKSQLTDSRKAVNDVKFAPRQLGLMLATASADGMVRIYEANDVFSLGYWPLQASYWQKLAPHNHRNAV